MFALSRFIVVTVFGLLVCLSGTALAQQPGDIVDSKILTGVATNQPNPYAAETAAELDAISQWPPDPFRHVWLRRGSGKVLLFPKPDGTYNAIYIQVIELFYWPF